MPWRTVAYFQRQREDPRTSPLRPPRSNTTLSGCSRCCSEYNHRVAFVHSHKILKVLQKKCVFLGKKNCNYNYYFVHYFFPFQINSLKTCMCPSSQILGGLYQIKSLTILDVMERNLLRNKMSLENIPICKYQKKTIVNTITFQCFMKNKPNWEHLTRKAFCLFVTLKFVSLSEY